MRRQILGALPLACVVLVFHARATFGFGIFEENGKQYPVVAIGAADTPPVKESGGAEAGPSGDVERVFLNSDGSLSYDCPKSVCFDGAFFGKGDLQALKDTAVPLPASSQAGSADSKTGSSSSYAGANTMPLKSSGDDVRPQTGSKEPRLKDLADVADMAWLGTVQDAHPLAFLKNSICGGLYFTPLQLSPATPDLACAIVNLDEQSVYLRRLESRRLQIGKGVKFVVNMSSKFALKVQDRNWRRRLARSRSLRLLVFLAQTFGRLKPNILKKNPATVINEILLRKKHLFYPLRELCLYVKVCQTVQIYPERLLQGFPRHVHPDHPSYVQLPIYSHLRAVGAEVAFPKDAPTIFQPRIYDGNIPVDRKSPIAKQALFKRIGGLFQEIKDNLLPVAADSVHDKGGSGIAEYMTSQEGTNAFFSDEESADGSGASKTLGEAGENASEDSAVESWKKETYLAWHNLWIINLIAYEASDLWGWVQYHTARNFMFPPWKVTYVGVLRTAEVAPMRWRDLSPRFHLDPFSDEEPEVSEQPLSASGETGKVPSLQRDLGTSAQAATQEKALNVGAHVKGSRVAGSKAFSESTGHFAGSSASQPAGSMEGFPSSTAADAGGETDTKPLNSSTGRSSEISTRQGELPKDGGTTSAAGTEHISRGKENEAKTVLEGCPPHRADLFFSKLRLPRGRLTTRGPRSNSSSHGDTKTANVGQDGSWAPVFVGTEVNCPPSVHPDTCGSTASFVRNHESPWIFRLDRDKSQMSQGKLDTLDYADIIWVFRGTFVSKLWLLNAMAVAVPYRTLSKRGRFHYGFAYLFHKVVRPVLERHLKSLSREVAEKGSPLSIVFTGHSLGGAIAQLSAWYFAKRAKALLDKGYLQIRTVAFGCPTWGDKTTYEDLHASGVKVQELNTEIDPVGVLFGEEDLSKLSSVKPFSIQLYVEDMDKVEVASSIPGAPPFSGRIWTRLAYRPPPLLKRLAAMVLDLEDVDMVLMDPMLAHFTAYTAFLTVMAGLLEKASFGSAVASPFIRGIPNMVGHPRNSALKEAHEALERLLRRVEEDRAAEQLA